MYQDTIAVRKGEELQVPLLENFLREKIEHLDDAPLEIRQFGLGASNLTYELRIGTWEAVLRRRSPLGPAEPTSHGMEREYKFLSGLHPVFPLVPKPYLYCEDEEILGSPFFVMERRRGVVLDTEFPEPYQPTPDLCQKISSVMVDRLVELHAIDYEAAGLQELVHPDGAEGYMKRQLNDWMGRYENAKTDEIEGVEALQKWLVDFLPASGKPAIIHHDYKLNNVMFDADDLTKMVGVFDWEMGAIGDPLADLGTCLRYWIQADDPDFLKFAFGKPPVTVLPGFYTREQFIEAYAEKSGRDVSQIHYYLTFANFKLAVICQQIYCHWKKGQTQDPQFTKFGEFARHLFQAAQQTAYGRSPE